MEALTGRFDDHHAEVARILLGQIDALVAVAAPGGTMGQAIGGVLPLAIGVAVSVVPIIAVILMLFTPRARSDGRAFVAGWGSLSSAGWC